MSGSVTLPSALRKFALDRFIWFLILGGGLFALHAYFDNPASRIRLGEADIDMLSSRWEAQTGSTPTPEEVNSLVEYHVREEILAREARRLGLDADDAILRRRLVQKMELLIRDRYEASPPAEDELRAYFAQHIADYEAPRRVGFRHVFLGTEDDITPTYLAHIQSTLGNSQSPDAWRSIGKPFMLARQYSPLSVMELTELFGPDFAVEIISAESGDQWIGPLRSAYGMHLVNVLTVLPATTPSFDTVRDRVAADYRSTEIAVFEAEAWRDIRARYRVSYPSPTK